MMKKSLTVLLALIAAAALHLSLSGTACQPKGDALSDSYKMFNNDLRWKRYDTAAQFMPPSMRGAFLEAVEKDEKDLNITDFEIKDVFADPDTGKAVVRVRIVWYMNNEAVEKRGMVTQTWELDKKTGAYVMTKMTGESPWAPKKSDKDGGVEDGGDEADAGDAGDGGDAGPWPRG